MKSAFRGLISSRMTKLVAGAGFTFLLAGLLLQLPMPWKQLLDGESTLITRASVRNFEAAYNNWREAYEQSGGDRYLVLALGWSKGLSAGFTTAKGQAKFDLIDKSVSIEVEGLPEESARTSGWLTMSLVRNAVSCGAGMGWYGSWKSGRSRRRTVSV
jgi:hypothetical protein